MGKWEFTACFSILFPFHMATAWHPKGLRIARAVSDLCRIYLGPAVGTTVRRSYLTTEFSTRRRHETVLIC
jgi:hypothetical protein